MENDTRPIAFQGEFGANSDNAARTVFPGRKTLPCVTFEDVFTAVENGTASNALIPIDNSIAGRVADIHTLLPHKTTRIIKEHFQPIEHYLFGVPGTTLQSVKTVRSHVHALAQCRTFLKKHNYQGVVAQDTAGAAREVAELKDTSIAALAPKLAGELYGLVVIAPDASDTTNNTTRFLVLSLDEHIPTIGTSVITSLFFRVQSLPAALYKAIGVFADAGINILKIESYMNENFESADFYIEVAGHPEVTAMKNALMVLAAVTDEVRILGVYEMSPYRKAPHTAS